MKATPPMVVRRVAVAELHADPANARTHDARNLASIQDSLDEWGQVEPLVVQKGTGRVIAGNGRLETMRRQGITEVDIHEVDVDDFTAARMAVALNRTAELAGWHKVNLAEVLKASMAAGLPTDSMGFTGPEVDELIAKACGDPASKGSGLAALSEVIRADPTTEVHPGDVFALGPHVLICEEILSGWPNWVPHLEPGRLFCPYPSPLLPLSKASAPLVLVQPDPYLAALTVDLYRAAFPPAGPDEAAP